MPRMLRAAWAVVALAVCVASCARIEEMVMAGEPNALYVAPDGSDANPGTRAKPFATLEGARDAIRALKKAGGLPEGGATVVIRGGVYERKNTFALTRADSGTPDAPVVYRAARGEEVRLVGGRVVTGWKPVADKATLDRLDPAARGNVVAADLKALGVADLGGVAGNRLELLFDDQPMTLARWPNDGFIKITGLVEPGTKNVRGTKGSKTGKFIYDGDRPARWAAEKDPWVHGYWFWDWSDQRHRVESIDTAKRTIAVKPPYHSYGYRVGQWFYGFNLLCEIDEPGEWYLDRQTATLYFWPPAPVDKGRAVVSVVDTLVTLKDVSHATLRGVVLEACRGTAVAAQGGTDVHVVGCTIRNIGGQAIRIAGATDSGAFGCDIYGVGDGGISLSGGDRKTLTPARLVAENNHIHHYGRWNRMYKSAIQLSGVGNRAAHNLIHNAPHMAIGFSGNEHVIEFNEVHSVCHESNDAGAMYAGRNWTMRGTAVRHNYLHHINGFEGRGCVGVYLDDMYCGTEISGNVFYKVTRAAFVGGGRDCTIANNIFVDCPRALHIDSRALGWAGYHADGWVKEGREKGTHLGIAFAKPPYSTRYPQLVNILDDEPKAPKGNVAERNIFVGERWNDVDGRAKKYVAMKDNLVDEDPQFAGTPPKSFALKKGSPAFKLGFKPIPFEKIGLYKDARRASWPVRHTVRPMAEAPKPKPRARKGPAPVVKLARGAAPVKVAVAEGIHGEKAGPPTAATFQRDGAHLLVTFDNQVDAAKPLKAGQTWGQDDAVEIAVRNPAAGKKAPILVLRGFTNGHFESSDEAGAPAKAVAMAARGVAYSAKVIDKSRWTAEWRIPLASLGIDPKKPARLQVNLTVRKTARDLWLMWCGTGGYSWEVAMAGMLKIAP